MKKFFGYLLPITLYASLDQDLINLFDQLAKLNGTLPQHIPKEPYPTFSAWKKKIFDNKPFLMDLATKEDSQAYQTTILSEAHILQTIDDFMTVMKNYLMEDKDWLHEKSPVEFLESPVGYEPYIENYLIAGTNSKIVAWGDIHGSIFSLLRTLEDLKDKGYLKDNFELTNKDEIRFLFLGDYVDRGTNSLEVLYTLMLLKIANRNNNRILIVRGNHETFSINEIYGLLAELVRKLGKDKGSQLHISFNGLFNLLPAAYFLAVDLPKREYMLCCHGGLDINIDPNPLLQSKKKFMKISKSAEILDKIAFNKEELLKSEYKHNIPEPGEIGFMWSDFYVDDGDIPIALNTSRGAGLICNKTGTQNILQAYSEFPIKSILRAHQHNNSETGPMLNLLRTSGGMVRLWDQKDPLVTTLLSAPEAGLGFNFDSYVLITINPEIKYWRFDHFSKEIPLPKTPFGYIDYRFNECCC